MGKVTQDALIKLAVMFAVLPALTTPGEACHRYSHWAYPWPQKCPSAREGTSAHEKTSPPKQGLRFKASRTFAPAPSSDTPSAADIERLRDALIRKLEAEPKQ